MNAGLCGPSSPSGTAAAFATPAAAMPDPVEVTKEPVIRSRSPGEDSDLPGLDRATRIGILTTRIVALPAGLPAGTRSPIAQLVERAAVNR